MSSPFQTILVEQKENTHYITFNRPEKRNALNLQMVNELKTLLQQLKEKYPPPPLVFQGNGDKAFMAGADIQELKERNALQALQAINANLMEEIAAFPFVTIAKIHGHCLGAGLELALACDLRIASDDATFAQPETGLNILPAAGALHRLPNIVGIANAKEMIFTGKKLNAKQAYQIGLIHQLVEKSQLQQATNNLLQQIQQQGPDAIWLAKRIFHCQEPPYPQELATFAQSYLFSSNEKKKRMELFLTKKKKTSSNQKKG